MIIGHFQHVPRSDFSDAPAYVPPDERPVLEAKVNRRHILTGILGLGFGAAVTSVVAPSLRRGDRAGNDDRGPTPVDVSKLPDWARDMLEKPPAHLIYNAGVYEMKGARHWRDQRLVPCFERLLDVAIETRSDDADAVGACAARALGRFGATEHLTRRLGAILARPQLQSTKKAALEWIEVVYRNKLDERQPKRK